LKALKWVLALVAFLVVVMTIVAAVVWSRLHPPPPGLQVWWNGNILTMDPESRRATALVIQSDRILQVGSDLDVARWLPRADVRLDLEGRTVVPGFVEAHGHFPGVGLSAVGANLNSPPIGHVKSIPEAIAAFRQVDAEHPGDGWLIGFGYDDTTLEERRHLNRTDLDQVSTERPIIAMHISGHMVAVNSLALERFGIDGETPDPEGGEIRKDRTGEPTGLLLETASRPLMLDALKLPPLQQIAVVRAAAQTYARQGFTTVQNGFAPLEQIQGLRMASELGLVPQRVVAWPQDELGLAAIDGAVSLDEEATDRLRIGAVKLIGDGSIQGYTGFLSEPYADPDGHPADYRGYPSMDSGTMNAEIKAIHCAGRQVAVHGNGDAAIDQFLDAWEAALRECPSDDARPILVHAQMARLDQLERMKRLGVTPTFFSAHVYYWGDRHRDVFLGPERAARISPAASALALGLRFSTHLDAPVVPIDSMLQLWAPVARETSSGRVLGPEERISAEQALRAMTSDAAWQLRMEDEIGSIRPGRKADLVILSDNPLEPSVDLRSIAVERTVANGVTIYERASL
jgi:predicted amidohydrolase YtcJ